MGDHAENGQHPPIQPKFPRLDAAIALLGGASQEKAAEAAGVKRHVLRGWLADPGFQSLRSNLEGACISAATTVLRRAAITAAEKLVERCQSSEKHADEIRAAGMVLDRVGIIAGAAEDDRPNAPTADEIAEALERRGVTR